MRKGDRQRIPHRRPDRDRGKGVVAARAIQVAKPQTRIAELPFSAAKPRASPPTALEFTAETDSALEGEGFEPSVPPEGGLSCPGSGRTRCGPGCRRA